MTHNLEHIAKSKITALYLLSAGWGLWFLSVLINLQFQQQLSTPTATVIQLIGTLFMFFSIWFGFRLFKLNRLESKNPNMAKQINDEREQFIRLKSLSNGFITCILLYSLYLSVAVISKVLFSEPKIYQLSGVFIGGVSLILAYFVAVYTHYRQHQL